MVVEHGRQIRCATDQEHFMKTHGTYGAGIHERRGQRVGCQQRDAEYETERKKANGVHLPQMSREHGEIQTRYQQRQQA
jgi:hypothetical protein